jgi:ecotin
MMKSIRLFTAGLLAAVCLSAIGEDAVHPQLKAFPVAEEGMVRHVIVLPHKERTEEINFKVEIVAGKTMETDGTNLYALGSNIETKPLKGWGYTFYKVTNGPAMSTMMAPPPGAEKVNKFISGKPLLIRYNNRLPIVIYAPEGYEVQYRIFEAPAKRTTATPN